MSLILHESDGLRDFLYYVLITNEAFARLKTGIEVDQAWFSSYYCEVHKNALYIIFIVLSLSDIIWFEMNIFPNGSYTTLCVHVEDKAACHHSVFSFSLKVCTEKVISAMLMHSSVTWKRDVSGDKLLHTEWMWLDTLLVCKKKTEAEERGEE